jgi:hypothetical protein
MEISVVSQQIQKHMTHWHPDQICTWMKLRFPSVHPHPVNNERHQPAGSAAGFCAVELLGAIRLRRTPRRLGLPSEPVKRVDDRRFKGVFHRTQ